MSVSIAILKVLSAYPEGRADYASLKASLAILSTPEWLNRMLALARRAGTVNIFTQKLAARDALGWMITAEGRALIERLEVEEELAAGQTERPKLRLVVSNQAADGEERPSANSRVVKSA